MEPNLVVASFKAACVDDAEQPLHTTKSRVADEAVARASLVLDALPMRQCQDSTGIGREAKTKGPLLGLGELPKPVAMRLEQFLGVEAIVELLGEFRLALLLGGAERFPLLSLSISLSLSTVAVAVVPALVPLDGVHLSVAILCDAWHWCSLQRSLFTRAHSKNGRPGGLWTVARSVFSE